MNEIAFPMPRHCTVGDFCWALADHELDDTKFLPRRRVGSQFPFVYGDPLANDTALSRIRWLFVVALNTRIKPSPQVGRGRAQGLTHTLRPSRTRSCGRS